MAYAPVAHSGTEITLSVTTDIACAKDEMQKITCINVCDSVCQTACGAHDRDGPIAHAHQLCQPARLKQRGHQHDVGSCIDLVRERLAIHDLQSRASQSS